MIPSSLLPKTGRFENQAFIPTTIDFGKVRPGNGTITKEFKISSQNGIAIFKSIEVCRNQCPAELLRGETRSSGFPHRLSTIHSPEPLDSMTGRVENRNCLMFSYTFKAKSSEGALVSGSMTADRREAVVSAPKQRGYCLLSVERQSRLSTILH